MTPDLASRLRLPERARARRPRWVLAVALAVAAALAATLAVPQSRSAFLRVLHLGGEEIHIVEKLPPVPPRLDLEVALGKRTTLADARRQANFPLRAPDEAPDRVYVGEEHSVTLLYGTPSDVRALITESRGVVSQKFFAKSAGPGTHIEYLKVNGADGGFISGRRDRPRRLPEERHAPTCPERAPLVGGDGLVPDRGRVHQGRGARARGPASLALR